MAIMLNSLVTKDHIGLMLGCEIVFSLPAVDTGCSGGHPGEYSTDGAEGKGSVG